MVDTHAHRAYPDAWDWEVLRGHYHAKRALELAASGNHSILLVGPPFAGKALLARSLVTILPDLPFVEPRPSTGESLAEALARARGGLLFLRHLDQWDEPLLALLRGAVGQQPGLFLLVATTSYCPCGKYADESQACHCTTLSISAYQERLSETIDRCFAIEVQIPGENRHLASVRGDEPSRAVRDRVEAARLSQYLRNGAGRLNSALSLAEVEQSSAADAIVLKLQALAHAQLCLSPQQGLYVGQLARTCADLARGPPATGGVAALTWQRPSATARAG